jgi:hypothetical protein
VWFLLITSAILAVLAIISAIIRRRVVNDVIRDLTAEGRDEIRFFPGLVHVSTPLGGKYYQVAWGDWPNSDESCVFMPLKIDGLDVHDRVKIVYDVPEGQPMWAQKKFTGVSVVAGFWPDDVSGFKVFDVTIHVHDPSDVKRPRRSFPRCPLFGW